MGKVIDLTTGDTKIWWRVVAGCLSDGNEKIQCDYVGDDEDFRGAQWSVCIRASTVDRIYELIEEAKLRLNRCIAANAVHSEYVPVGHKTKAAKPAAGRR